MSTYRTFKEVRHRTCSAGFQSISMAKGKMEGIHQRNSEQMQDTGNESPRRNQVYTEIPMSGHIQPLRCSPPLAKGRLLLKKRREQQKVSELKYFQLIHPPSEQGKIKPKQGRFFKAMMALFSYVCINKCDLTIIKMQTSDPQLTLQKTHRLLGSSR